MPPQTSQRLCLLNPFLTFRSGARCPCWFLAQGLIKVWRWLLRITMHNFICFPAVSSHQLFAWCRKAQTSLFFCLSYIDAEYNKYLLSMAVGPYSVWACIEICWDCIRRYFSYEDLKYTKNKKKYLPVNLSRSDLWHAQHVAWKRWKVTLGMDGWKRRESDCRCIIQINRDKDGDRLSSPPPPLSLCLSLSALLHRIIGFVSFAVRPGHGECFTIWWTWSSR